MVKPRSTLSRIILISPYMSTFWPAQTESDTEYGTWPLLRSHSASRLHGLLHTDVP